MTAKGNSATRAAAISATVVTPPCQMIVNENPEGNSKAASVSSVDRARVIADYINRR